MNKDKLYAAFNAGLTILTLGRITNKDLTPIRLLCCEAIQRQYCDCPLVALLDGGSSGRLLNRKIFPKGAYPSWSKQNEITIITSGLFDTSLSVELTNVKLHAIVQRWLKYRFYQHVIFNSPSCQYDIILERAFLCLAGIEMLFKIDSIQWIDRYISM